LGASNRQHGIGVFVAGEIEEVVVLPEADAAEGERAARQQHRARANRLGQRLPARVNSFGGEAKALGGDYGRERADQAAISTNGQSRRREGAKATEGSRSAFACGAV
jgi:hypothetical protein